MKVQRIGHTAAMVAALVLLAGALPAHAQATDDERAVVAVVQRLFDAMKAKDTAAMHALIEPGARLTSVRPGPGGATRLQALPASDFIARVGRDTRGEWIERIFNPEVRVSGALASVWTEYDFHLGPTFSHCGVDALQLLKLADGWKIVALADTNVPAAGCSRRAPP